MIRLTQKREPSWLDVGYGVRLYVNPLEFWVYRAAEFESWTMTAELAKREGAIGPDEKLTAIDDVTQYNKYVGLQQQFMLQALARHAIIEWEGVGNEDGTDLCELTPSNVDALISLQPVIARSFERQYLASVEEIIQEGEGLGSAPMTTSMPEPIDAPTAESLAATSQSAHSTPTDQEVMTAT